MEENNQTNELTVNTVDTDTLSVNTVDINSSTVSEEIPEMITNDTIDTNVDSNIAGFDYTSISNNSDIPSFEPEPVDNIAGIPSFETNNQPAIEAEKNNPTSINDIINYDNSTVGAALTNNVETNQVVIQATNEPIVNSVPVEQITQPVFQESTGTIENIPVEQSAQAVQTGDIPVEQVTTNPIIQTVTEEAISTEPVYSDNIDYSNQIANIQTQSSLDLPIETLPAPEEISATELAPMNMEEPVSTNTEIDIIDNKINPSTLFNTDINSETGIESPSELSNTPTMFEYQNNIQDKNLSGVSRDDLIGTYTGNNNTVTGENVSLSFEDQINNAQDLNTYVQKPKNNTPVMPVVTTQPVYNSNIPSSLTTPTPVVQQKVTPVNNTTKDTEISKSLHSNSTGPSPFKEKSSIAPKIAFFMLYLIVLGVLGYLAYNWYTNKKQIQLRKSNVELALGSSYQEIIYIEGVPQKNDDYDWKIADDKIVSVTDGKIKGLSIGETTIDVVGKKNKKSYTIVVNVVDLKIESLTVDKTEQQISSSRTYTITPIINGQSKTIVDLDWKSSNKEIAEVNNEGLVTPHKKGSVTITISAPNTDKSVDVLLEIN